MPCYLPNSRLVGVQLVVSTPSGPQVVYHYPPCSPDHDFKKKKILKREPENGNSGRPSNSADLNHRVTDLRLSRQISKEDSNLNASISSPKNTTALHDISNIAYTDYSDNTSLSSESSDPSSGLSDSELSTDYSDVSTGSSEHHSIDSDVNSIDKIEDSTTYLSHVGSLDSLQRPQSYAPDAKSIEIETKSSRSDNKKSGQISANKLLDIFNTDSNLSPINLERRSSLTSKISNSNFSQDANSNVKQEPEDDNDSDSELISMLEKKIINYNPEFFDQEHFQDTNKIFGFDAEFIAEICCPERDLCNKSFEFTVNNLCFMGLPVHVDSGNSWKKQKKKTRTRSKKSSSTKSSRRRSNSSSSAKVKRKSSNLNLKKVNSSPSRPDEGGEFDQPNSENPDVTDFNKSMTMFHVCFVMNPPLSEYNERIEDVFRNVVSKLTVSLRSAQAKSNYVSKQCEIILKEKELVLKNNKKYKTIRGSGNKGRYMYQRILAKSSLARALTTCVDTLQKNEVARLAIGDDKILTLQIPLHNEFSALPKVKVEPVLRGSFLTSILNATFLSSINKKADNIKNLDMNDEDTNDDLLNYALLLLDEPSNIIAALEMNMDKSHIGGIVLRHLIKHIQPNIPLKNYQSVIDDMLEKAGYSDSSGAIPFQMNILNFCALHLLYWRHARAVLPLNTKNVYIVSPIAPIQNSINENNWNSNGMAKFQKPLIYRNQEIFKNKFPSLPPLPAFLSLLSNGSPKSYGLIIPSKEHKPIYLGALAWLIRYGYVTQLLTFVYIRVDKQIKIAVDEDLEKDGYKSKRKSGNRKEVQIDNVAETKTTDKQNDESQNSTTEVREEEEDIPHFQYDDPEVEKDYTIILEPERSGALERRWIYKCIQDQPSDIHVLFNKMLKYLNGRVPMELAIIKEEISRHDLKKLLYALKKYLIEVNHW